MPRRRLSSLDPLIPPGRRRLAHVVLGACVLVVLGLGAWFHGQSRPDALDRAVDGWVADRNGRFLSFALRASEPRLVVTLFVVLLLAAALRQRWDVFVLAVLTPLVSLFAVEVVLKPLVGRTNGQLGPVAGTHALAYPSGHECGVGSLLAVLALLVLRGRWPAAAKTAAVAGLAAVLLLSALGLIGAYYHYATDTVGSVGVVCAVVAGVSLALDAARARWCPPRPVTRR